MILKLILFWRPANITSSSAATNPFGSLGDKIKEQVIYFISIVFKFQLYYKTDMN